MNFIMGKYTSFEKTVNCAMDDMEIELKRENFTYTRNGGTVSIEVHNKKTDTMLESFKKIMGKNIPGKSFNKVCKLNTYNDRMYVRFKREVHC